MATQKDSPVQVAPAEGKLGQSVGYHKVCTNYYPPSGHAKDGWDNIDIFRPLGYPMQIKTDFLCRDSILAAPLALDVALFIRRAGMREDLITHLGLDYYD